MKNSKKNFGKIQKFFEKILKNFQKIQNFLKNFYFGKKCRNMDNMDKKCRNMDIIWKIWIQRRNMEKYGF